MPRKRQEPESESEEEVEEESVSKKKFRANRKKFFLTYPQCPLMKEDILSFLRTKSPLTKYLIAQEKHQDGGFHIHVFAEFTRKLNITSQSAFDYKGYHCNIVS